MTLLFHSLSGCDTIILWSEEEKGYVEDIDGIPPTVWSPFHCKPTKWCSWWSHSCNWETHSTFVWQKHQILLLLMKSGSCATASTQVDIPSTSIALKQNVLRAVAQASHIWSQSIRQLIVIPNVSQCGWKEYGKQGWISMWTTIGQMKDLCLELISCKCGAACGGNCKCSRASWLLCRCKGFYFNNQN